MLYALNVKHFFCPNMMLFWKLNQFDTYIIKKYKLFINMMLITTKDCNFANCYLKLNV